MKKSWNICPKNYKFSKISSSECDKSNSLRIFENLSKRVSRGKTNSTIEFQNVQMPSLIRNFQSGYFEISVTESNLTSSFPRCSRFSTFRSDENKRFYRFSNICARDS